MKITILIYFLIFFTGISQPVSDFVAEIIPCPQTCNFTNYKISNKSLNISDNQQNIINNVNLISVHPNPSKNIFNIHINCKNVSGKILLYDNLGNIILSKYLTKDNIVLDLSNYYSGIYIIKFLSNDYTVTQKIIKQ